MELTMERLRIDAMGGATPLCINSARDWRTVTFRFSTTFIASNDTTPLQISCLPVIA
jgi:hypothetical protein